MNPTNAMKATTTLALPQPAGADACSTLAGHDILCLATQEWEAHWTPVQQVMRRLAPRNRVIYFEPFHPPLAWMKTGNSLLQRRRSEGTAKLREVHPNLFVYTPSAVYLPFHMKSAVAQAWNSQQYKKEIGTVLRRLGSPCPWLWVFFAQCLSVLDLPFERFVYDCVDYWPAFFPEPRENQFVSRVNEELARRADLVFVGSKPLLGQVGGFNPNTFVVPHAADIAHFAKAAEAATRVPSDLTSVPHPRIGFVGMMDAVRFDAGLIRQLAANPDYHIVIVGGLNGRAEQLLPASANVHWLGMKPVAELPNYLKGMDVCIMPYRLNEATTTIYPLKLHEYMATGKPVVTTRIPAVEEFRDLLYVADSPEEFLALVRCAIAEQVPDLVARRQTCAKEHTWEAHVEAKARLIRDHLGGLPS